jgi:hypothetical protein
MFDEYRGRQLVFNVSFIKGVRELQELPNKTAAESAVGSSRPYWLEGFGIWSGTKPENIEITIAPPASRYFAAQSWHPDQEDVWDGENLVRSFPGIPSPELNRRILSLGRHVVSVQPPSVLEQLRVDVKHLGLLCSEDSTKE